MLIGSLPSARRGSISVDTWRCWLPEPWQDAENKDRSDTESWLWHGVGSSCFAEPQALITLGRVYGPCMRIPKWDHRIIDDMVHGLKFMVHLVLKEHVEDRYDDAPEGP